MKNRIKYILQRILGLNNYLYVFALYKIRTLKSDKKENDFFTFLALLKDGKGDVLDVGANLGIMTVHLAKTLPNTRIHAFEPMPENLSILKRISKKFGLNQTTIHELAVGEEPGTAKMILPVNDGTVMQGLSHMKHDTITEWNDGREVEVHVEKIDNVINGQLIQGIKIDVENFEYFAFKGAKRILEQNKPIIYAELWDNENRQLCFDFLHALNYKTYVTEQGRLTEFNPVKHQKQNFIFLAD